MTKAQIFLYWKDFFISKTGQVIHTNDRDKTDTSLWYPTQDWGEPNCWACGCCLGPDYEEVKGEIGLTGIANNWNSVDGCQKCHVIPRSLGGKLTESNLFLMCPFCHDVAPDTTIPSLFFTWVYHRKDEYQSELKETIAFISKESKKYGIYNRGEFSVIFQLVTFRRLIHDIYDISNEVDILFMKELDKAGVHRMQMGGNSCVKQQTLVAISCAFYNNNKELFIKEQLA